MHSPQFGTGNAVVYDHDGARLMPERRDRIEGYAVVGAIGRWLDDHLPGDAEPALQGAVVLDERIARERYAAAVGGIARIIDEMMAIAGIGRRLQPGALAAAGPFDLSGRRRCVDNRTGRDPGHDRQHLATIGFISSMNVC